MKTYPSPTMNRGQTIILDDAADAIEYGRDYLSQHFKTLEGYTGKYKVRKLTRTDGGKAKVKTVTMSASKLIGDWKECADRFDLCCTAIVEGDATQKAAIAAMVEQLRDAAVEIEPMLACTYHGYQRSEDGVTAAAELVAAGEERCCFQRKRSGEGVVQREGDGAFKVIINTDVAWWGRPDDNCAVMGALVTLLQSRGPVEIWIQQGWLGGYGTSPEPNDGVTLFKLDFTGAFDPSQLAFWLGHPFKDSTFSFVISRALGRVNTSTSTVAEIPCDLYLRGDWMTLAGLTATAFTQMLHTERLDIMARWIAATAMQIVNPAPVIEIH